MLDVLFTVDVEVWCDGWDDIDRKFPRAFREYVYGPTDQGDCGLPLTLRLLGDHGLAGVFFVEPLFAARFGAEPLAEIVGLVRDAGQEVQLHLHPEWVDEAREPLLGHVEGKRQHLCYYSLDEQKSLLARGAAMIERAGGGTVNAFRAGSFAFNRDTLLALAHNGIRFDSSYNAASEFARDSGVMPGATLVDTARCDGVCEVPMTVFDDGTRSLRHAQLTACSFAELEGLLWQALESGRRSFVILSHNFELLSPTRQRADTRVIDRFRQLCRFLERHRDSFRTTGFRGFEPPVAAEQPRPLASPLWKTGARMVEQALRRTYR